MKTFALHFFLLLSAFSAWSQTAPAQEGIKWISFEEMLVAQKTEPRKVIIDVYTDWCGWCKRMDATTMQNPFIIQAIRESYYAVKLDAEQKEDIVVQDRTYKFVPQGGRGYHELAAELLQGKMSYPTLVFLDENINMIQPLPGFRTPKELDPILHYFGGNYYRMGVAWDQFQKEYKSPVTE